MYDDSEQRKLSFCWRIVRQRGAVSASFKGQSETPSAPSELCDGSWLRGGAVALSAVVL